MSYSLIEVEKEMNDIDSINAKIAEIFYKYDSYAEYMGFSNYNEKIEDISLLSNISSYKTDFSTFSVFCAGAVAQCQELETAMLDNIQHKYEFQYDDSYKPDFDSEDFVSVHKFINSILSIDFNEKEIDFQKGLNAIFGDFVSDKLSNNLKNDFVDYVAIRNHFCDLCKSVYPNRNPDEIQAMANIAVVYDMDEYSDATLIKKSDYLREYAMLANTTEEKNKRNLAAELATGNEYMHALFGKNIYQDYDKNIISSYPLLSSEFIRSYADKLNWDLISKNRVFSNEDIKEFRELINFDLLKFNPYLSADIIRKEHIDMSYLLQTSEFKHAKEIADSINYFDYIDRHDNNQSVNYVLSSQPNNIFEPKLTCYNNETEKLIEFMADPNPLEGPAYLKMGEAKQNLKIAHEGHFERKTIIDDNRNGCCVRYNLEDLAKKNPEQFKLFVENYEAGIKSLSKEKIKDLEKDTILRDDDVCK